MSSLGHFRGLTYPEIRVLEQQNDAYRKFFYLSEDFQQIKDATCLFFKKPVVRKPC